MILRSATTARLIRAAHERAHPLAGKRRLRIAQQLLLCILPAALAWGCRAAPRPAQLRIFAASSLTEAFAELERDFERENLGVDVIVTAAGSQILAVQIERGAHAEFFASAHEDHVDRLRAGGFVTHNEVFASNELVVIVPEGNPAHIESVADLPLAEKIVLGAEDVPIGAYTREFLSRADASYGESFSAAVEAHVVSREANVRLVRAKIALGEADAAIVYRSDVISQPRIRAIEIPSELRVEVEYHLAELSGGEQPELARRWVAHLRTPAGARALVRHGFTTAEAP